MFWRKRRSPQDFRAELESHIALEADQLRGASAADDPEGAARRAFGNVASVEEAQYEHRRWMLFDHFKRDLRQALRQVRQRPGFAAMVVLTLALGIGANSAIFSVIEAVLLRPLPYKDPARLAMLYSADPARELHEGRVSLLNFADWKSQNRSFSDLTAFIGQTFLLGTDGAPERLRSARVSANFWSILGATPELGRVFSVEEELHAARVAVLSYGLWQEKFGGSPDALGANLVMDGRTYRVIGVMRKEFRFPFADTSVWEPISAHPNLAARDLKSARTVSIWMVLGRLRDGISWQAATADMAGIGRRLQADYPESQLAPNIDVVPLDLQATAKFRLSLWMLFGAVFLMLVIACINVAGLLLARGSARRREFALRRTLGAGRLRLAGQLITETLVLSVFGGMLRLALASTAVKALVASGPPDIPRLTEARIDGMVLLFAAAVSIFTALFASVWPAFQSGSEGAAGSRQWMSISTQPLRDLLVAGEFALALVLVAGAGLLVHSFLRLQAVELGFRPDHMLMMRVDLHVGRTRDQQDAYFREVTERLRSLPGVQSAAAITGFLRTDPEEGVEVEGRPPQHPGPCDDAITGPFFETAGIPLKKGRYFNSDDRRESPPVVIVNETMARAYWPNADPLQKRFRFDSATPWLTVVGVTGDMRRQGIERRTAPQVYRPHSQVAENMMEILVRTAVEPMTMAAAIESEIHKLDPGVAKFKVATVEQRLAEQTSERRFDTSLIGIFALVALFLSAMGIYGLMHHLVVQRTSEIGLRVALGAQRATVLGLILRQGLGLAFMGVLAGLICTYALSRLLSKLLYEVTPTDPITFGTSALLLLAVAVVACWIPARRAARIDPMLALRQE